MIDLEKIPRKLLEKALIKAAEQLIIDNHGYLIDEFVEGQILELIAYGGKENE